MTLKKVENASVLRRKNLHSQLVFAASVTCSIQTNLISNSIVLLYFETALI